MFNSSILRTDPMGGPDEANKETVNRQDDFGPNTDRERERRGGSGR
jgi:hypothetical protein